MLKEIIERRSIRKYKKKEVPRKIIEEIIEAGRLSPSGKNKQPWKFIVFTGEAKRELLSRMEEGINLEEKEKRLLPKSTKGMPDAKNTLKIMKEAPVIITVLNIFSNAPFGSISGDERVTEIIDSLSIGASIENMLLQANALNIGTLWIGNTCFAYPQLCEYIGTESQLVGAIALGYSDETPNKRPRKSTEEIVEYRS